MLSVYGASKLRLRRARGGHRPGGRAATTGCWSRSSSTAASTRSRCSRRPPTRSTSSLRPTLALPEGAGTPFAEDPSLRWNPAAAAFDALHRAGKMSVLPGVGYSSPDQSHFTSRHYWEVGAPAAERGHRLDGPADRHDRHPRQPASGALARRLARRRRWRPASLPVAAIDGPSYDLWARGRLGHAGGADVRRRRRARPRRRRGPRTRACRPPAARPPRRCS